MRSRFIVSQKLRPRWNYCNQYIPASYCAHIDIDVFMAKVLLIENNDHTEHTVQRTNTHTHQERKINGEIQSEFRMSCGHEHASKTHKLIFIWKMKIIRILGSTKRCKSSAFRFLHNLMWFRCAAVDVTPAIVSWWKEGKWASYRTTALALHYSNYFPTITENVSIPTKLPSATISLLYIGPNMFDSITVRCVPSQNVWQKVFLVPNANG